MNIKEFIKKVLQILFSILTIILLFTFFRWAGIKGLLSFLIGMLIMAFLILSKNPVMTSIIAMTQSEDFIDTVMDKKEKNK